MVADARGAHGLEQIPEAIEHVRDHGHEVELLFLEASDEVVARRYSETRRRHPLAESVGLDDAIARDRKLLEPLAFLSYRQAKILEELGTPEAPATPALLLTTGCTTGHPDNPLLGDLALGGWVASICTSTHQNGPMPLIAAIRAERCAPRYLSEGLSVGLAQQATLGAYLSDSVLDPLGWVLSPWSWNQRAVNVLSYVVYGDPSLALVEREPRSR